MCERNRRNPLQSGPISIAVLTALLGVPTAQARPTIRRAFFDAYPSAVGSRLDSVPSKATHCGVCHFDFNGAGLRTPYGNAVAGTPNRTAAEILGLGNLDSDNDGYTNNVEITNLANYSNTPTFPGLTPGNVGSVTNVALADIQPYLVPMAAQDTTPPVVTVVSPNGGESLVANQGVTVQWTATDASGIASIGLYLSINNGASYKPLLLSIPHTGSRTVFLPNRPTAQAWLRVVARDNAANQGQDDSNAAFTIASPPGGIAPTTLRDFDLPGTEPLQVFSLSNPATCASCHGNYNSAVEPYANWQGSMMAHASIDPLFEACTVIANQDAPDSGDLCLRCHISAGWLQGRSVPTSGSQMLSTDKFGVSCDLCHRMVDPISDPANPAEDTAILAGLALVPQDFGNGTFVVDPVGSRRGPFTDVDPALGHPFLVSPFHREAALCGTCHDVSNPAFEKDGSGNYVPNAFNTPPTSMSSLQLMPIERTYSEWLNSAYNTPAGVYAPQFGGNKSYVSTCQDCHMKDVTGLGCNVPGAPLRNDLPLHDMTGGSAWLTGVLATLFPAQVDPTAAAAGQVRSRYLLQNALELAVSQDGTKVRVRLTNNSGHKLPTGYPEGRRIWINLKLLDASSSVLFESGTYDALTGELDHSPGVKIYETKPGLDSITAPLVGEPEGPSFHFVLNNKIWKDNRIPPRGFTNAAFAAFGGAPTAYSYPDGQYWDDTSYALRVGATSAVVTVYYQSTSKEYIEFLRDENTTNSVGQDLYNLWVGNNRCPPELMATATISVTAPDVEPDFDNDADVDVDDLAYLHSCATRAGVAQLDPSCDEADLDDDGDVDMTDFAIWQRCYSGTDETPAPGCDQ